MRDRVPKVGFSVMHRAESEAWPLRSGIGMATVKFTRELILWGGVRDPAAFCLLANDAPKVYVLSRSPQISKESVRGPPWPPLPRRKSISEPQKESKFKVQTVLLVCLNFVGSHLPPKNLRC